MNSGYEDHIYIPVRLFIQKVTIVVGLLHCIITSWMSDDDELYAGVRHTYYTFLWTDVVPY